MSKGSIRIGFSSRGEQRTPGVGRHLGLFHFISLNEKSGRVITVGYLRFDRADLEPLREKGVRVRLTVVGVLRLHDDVSPALANDVLDARVYGRILADERTSAATRAS